MRALAAPITLVLLLATCNITPAPQPAPAPTTDTAAVSGLPRERPVEPRPPSTSTIPPTTTLPPATGALPAAAWANWPSWRITATGVPYYAGHPACTVEQAETVARQFAARGAGIDSQRWAIYVASREGGCNYLATNINARTGDDSHCAFQLNARDFGRFVGPLHPRGALGQLGWTPASVKASLDNCAAAAAALWAICGKGPWIKGDYGCRRPSA